MLRSLLNFSLCGSRESGSISTDEKDEDKENKGGGEGRKGRGEIHL